MPTGAPSPRGRFSGNYTETATDALGNTTTYGYDLEKGVLLWYKAPEDTDATQTNYTYDSMFRTATAAATTDTGLHLSAQYSYEDDLLTQIKTPSTTYSFGYGDFALRSSESIGTRTLASYTYTERNHYLQELEYGNGDSVQYTYDNVGRLLTQTYEDGDTVSYTYDNSGALAKVTDSATGRTTTSYYDFTDRLMKTVEEGVDYYHSVGYTYDRINNLTQLVEKVNGTEHTTSYTYDDDNRITSKTTDGITVSYTYDAFGRVTQQTTKNGETLILTESFTYNPGHESGQSAQVATYTTTANGYSVTYSYTYDKNGNILTISDGTYTTSYEYDSANQLIRENNQSKGYTYLWEYDDAGNRTLRERYTYTVDSVEEITANSTQRYFYGDEEWGDLLTGYAYGSSETPQYTFTYDTIGNVLSDGDYTYTWEHGRQLAQVQIGADTWNYTYDVDGLRTGRSTASKSYSYIYSGSQLIQMKYNNNTLYFTYDTAGTPLTVDYNGTVYYFVTNIQGDVVAILNGEGTAVVHYTYDAWGNPLSRTGSMGNSLGAYNPLRYRGYVYDNETGLYYLQSRYYDSEIGRFI
ncbi:MAG: RHS repeat protein, partial [Oscillospiraceae bacterium]|nr:RHS repeat protein [Oscillospiraceae bacterium]